MQKRRYLRPGIVAIALLVVYTLAGFLVLPSVLANMARDTVKAESGRELLNLSELEPATSTGPKPASDEPLPRLFIGELAVTQGRVRFEDRDRPKPFVANVAPVTFRLSNFSTYTADGERYELDATVFDTSHFTWRGTLKSRPLASAGELNLAALAGPPATPAAAATGCASGSW